MFQYTCNAMYHDPWTRKRKEKVSSCNNPFLIVTLATLENFGKRNLQSTVFLSPGLLYSVVFCLLIKSLTFLFENNILYLTVYPESSPNTDIISFKKNLSRLISSTISLYTPQGVRLGKNIFLWTLKIWEYRLGGTNT